MSAASFRRIALSLEEVSEEILSGALRTAWKLRIDKNKKSAGTTGILPIRS